MSDRVVVMNEGRIEQIGAPRDIYERPRTRFVAGFVGVTNLLDGVVASTRDDGALVEVAGGRVAVSEPLEPGSHVTLAVRPEKIRFAPAGNGSGLDATVEESRYLGDVTQWRVRLGDESLWTVVAQNDGDGELLAAGRRVGLAWDPEHSVRLEQ